jgi:hypothetical protein
MAEIDVRRVHFPTPYKNLVWVMLERFYLQPSWLCFFNTWNGYNYMVNWVMGWSLMWSGSLMMDSELLKKMLAHKIFNI